MKGTLFTPEQLSSAACPSRLTSQTMLGGKCNARISAKPKREYETRGPSELDPNENLQSCELTESGLFRHLCAAALRDFEAVMSFATYPRRALLFVEEQDPRGVFVLFAGKVKLSISSSAGKMLILRIAKAGEILGLMAAISGGPYEVTAETLQTCQVAFLHRDDFLHFVARHPEAYQGVVTQLGKLYRGACEQLRIIGLSASVPEKLARFFLDCSADLKGITEGKPVNLGLTHQEIAERIGTTRETVSRALSEFKSRRLMALQGAALMIYDRPALEAIGCQHAADGTQEIWRRKRRGVVPL